MSLTLTVSGPRAWIICWITATRSPSLTGRQGFNKQPWGGAGGEEEERRGGESGGREGEKGRGEEERRGGRRTPQLPHHHPLTPPPTSTHPTAESRLRRVAVCPHQLLIATFQNVLITPSVCADEQNFTLEASIHSSTPSSHPPPPPLRAANLTFADSESARHLNHPLSCDGVRNTCHPPVLKNCRVCETCLESTRASHCGNVFQPRSSLLFCQTSAPALNVLQCTSI